MSSKTTRLSCKMVLTFFWDQTDLHSRMTRYILKYVTCRRAADFKFPPSRLRLVKRCLSTQKMVSVSLHLPVNDCDRVKWCQACLVLCRSWMQREAVRSWEFLQYKWGRNILPLSHNTSLTSPLPAWGSIFFSLISLWAFKKCLL